MAAVKINRGHQGSGRRCKEVVDQAGSLADLPFHAVIYSSAKTVSTNNKLHQADLLFLAKKSHMERSVTKPDTPVLYYLHDGLKHGFVCEELLVVPLNTEFHLNKLVSFHSQFR